MISIRELSNNFSRIEGSILRDLETFNKLKKEKLELENKLSILDGSINLARSCIEKSLEQKKIIEDLVTSGLNDVFDADFSFILEPIYDGELIKGLRPRIKEGLGDYDDPITSFGAGINAIISVCFKISLLLLTGETAKILVLDEPLANLNPAMQERFQAFIENICEETGLQIILVTHMNNPFGTIWEVKKDKKVSNVRRIDV